MNPRRSAAAGRADAATAPAPTAGCEIGELFQMLGQPHMLRVLHAFGEADGRPIRFNQLQGRLALSPKTLTQRLKTLVAAGFLSRHSYNEIPPRVEYVRTAKTVELDELFAALERWSRHHTLHETPMVATVGRVRLPNLGARPALHRGRAG
jgi:DNA-binding HxlR family transcriptional regulator